jgi:hypothetical protein
MEVDYERTLALQDGKCAICGDVQGLRRRLAMDHDHINGKVRGLLCGRCNVGLGLAGDNPTLLRAMAEYLERGGSGKPIIMSLRTKTDIMVEAYTGTEKSKTRRGVITLGCKMEMALKKDGRMTPEKLATVLGVKLKRINETVKRNRQFRKAQGTIILTVGKSSSYSNTVEPLNLGSKKITPGESDPYLGHDLLNSTESTVAKVEPLDPGCDQG